MNVLRNAPDVPNLPGTGRHTVVDHLNSESPRASADRSTNAPRASVGASPQTLGDPAQPVPDGVGVTCRRELWDSYKAGSTSLFKSGSLLQRASKRGWYP